MRDIVKNLN